MRRTSRRRAVAFTGHLSDPLTPQVARVKTGDKVEKGIAPLSNYFQPSIAFLCSDSGVNLRELDRTPLEGR